jgi:hypothetical protein
MLASLLVAGCARDRRSPGERLHDAVRMNDRETVIALLDSGVSIESRLPATGWTPLFWSCLQSNAEMTRLLIERGAEVNVRARDGRTPLISAVGLRPEFFDASGTPVQIESPDPAEVVRLLLAAGAEVDVRDEKGNNPLALALIFGQDDALAVLLEAGADPDTMVDEQFTCLQVAAGRGRTAAVRLLLEHGADPRLEDSQGRTALDHALLGGHEETAALLRRAMEASEAEGTSST